jgi:hypothetical protein
VDATKEANIVAPTTTRTKLNLLHGSGIIIKIKVQKSSCKDNTRLNLKEASHYPLNASKRMIGSSNRSIMGFIRVEGWVRSRSKGIFFGTEAGFVLVQPGTATEELGMEGFLELASTMLLWVAEVMGPSMTTTSSSSVAVRVWHPEKTTSRKLRTKH